MTTTAAQVQGIDAPGVQLEFQNGVTPEQRRSVELSIAAMVTRSNQATASVLAASAERAELTTTLHRPLLTLIESDPAAAQALGHGRSQTSVETPIALRPIDSFGRVGGGLATLDLDSGPELFGFPFHFQWSWHNTAGGSPLTSVVDPPTGQVGLDARAGAGTGGGVDVPFVDAHAGFGIFLTTDHVVTATARALRSVAHRYSLSAGLNAAATSEGGVEFTVFEDGNFIAVARDVIWRRRVSGTLFDPTESASFDSDGSTATAAMDLTWTMHPGRGYTFNVGLWAFGERHPGIGGAGVASVIQGKVILMSLFR